MSKSRYLKTPSKRINGKILQRTTLYPSIPVSQTDIYVYITVGDRYDSLAYQYYKDSSLWYIIALANPSQPKDSLTPEIGSQIRIPNSTTVANITGFLNNIV